MKQMDQSIIREYVGLGIQIMMLEMVDHGVSLEELLAIKDQAMESYKEFYEKDNS